MYEQSHRDYLRSGYLHHRSACHGLLIITVTHGLFAALATAAELPEAGERGLLLTRRCVSVMLLRSMQNAKELADAQS